MVTVSSIRDLLVDWQPWFRAGCCNILRTGERRFRLTYSGDVATLANAIRRTLSQKLPEGTTFRMFRCGLDRTYCFDVTTGSVSVLLRRLRHRLSDDQLRGFRHMMDPRAIRHEIERRRWLCWTREQVVAGRRGSIRLASVLLEAPVALDLSVGRMDVRLDLVVRRVTGGAPDCGEMVSVKEQKDHVTKMVQKQIQRWEVGNTIGYAPSASLNKTRNDLTITFANFTCRATVDLRMHCHLGYMKKHRQWSMTQPHVQRKVLSFTRLVQSVVAYNDSDVTITSIECGLNPLWTASDTSEHTQDKRGFQDTALLRWSKQDIRNGSKQLPNVDKPVNLARTLADHRCMVKCILRVATGQYVDVSMSFILFVLSKHQAHFINWKSQFNPYESMLESCVQHRYFKVILTICRLKATTTSSIEHEDVKLVFKLIRSISTTDVGVLEYLRHQCDVMIDLIEHAGIPADVGLFIDRLAKALEPFPQETANLTDLRKLADRQDPGFLAYLKQTQATLAARVNHACYPLIEYFSKRLMERLSHVFISMNFQALQKHAEQSYKQYCTQHPITKIDRTIRNMLRAEIDKQYIDMSSSFQSDANPANTCSILSQKQVISHLLKIADKQIQPWKAGQKIDFFQVRKLNNQNYDLTMMFTGSIRTPGVFPTDVDLQMYCRMGHVYNKKWSLGHHNVQQKLRSFARLLQTVVAYDDPAVTLIVTECGINPLYRPKIDPSTLPLKQRFDAIRRMQDATMLLWTKQEVRDAKKRLPNSSRYIRLTEAMTNHLCTVKTIVRVGSGQYIDVDIAFKLYASTNNNEPHFINLKTLYADNQGWLKYCFRNRFYKVLKTIRTICGREKNKSNSPERRDMLMSFLTLINYISTTRVGLLHHLQHQCGVMIDLINHADVPADIGVFADHLRRSMKCFPADMADMTKLVQLANQRDPMVSSALKRLKTTLGARVNHACYPLIDFFCQRILDRLPEVFNAEEFGVLRKHAKENYLQYCRNNPVMKIDHTIRTALRTAVHRRYDEMFASDASPVTQMLYRPSLVRPALQCWFETLFHNWSRGNGNGNVKTNVSIDRNRQPRKVSIELYPMRVEYTADLRLVCAVDEQSSDGLSIKRYATLLQWMIRSLDAVTLGLVCEPDQRMIRGLLPVDRSFPRFDADAFRKRIDQLKIEGLLDETRHREIVGLCRSDITPEQRVALLQCLYKGMVMWSTEEIRAGKKTTGKHSMTLATALTRYPVCLDQVIRLAPGCCVSVQTRVVILVRRYGRVNQQLTLRSSDSFFPACCLRPYVAIQCMLKAFRERATKPVDTRLIESVDKTLTGVIQTHLLINRQVRTMLRVIDASAVPTDIRDYLTRLYQVVKKHPQYKGELTNMQIAMRAKGDRPDVKSTLRSLDKQSSDWLHHVCYQVLLVSYGTLAEHMGGLVDVNFSQLLHACAGTYLQPAKSVAIRTAVQQIKQNLERDLLAATKPPRWNQYADTLAQIERNMLHYGRHVRLYYQRYADPESFARVKKMIDPEVKNRNMAIFTYFNNIPARFHPLPSKLYETYTCYVSFIDPEYFGLSNQSIIEYEPETVHCTRSSNLILQDTAPYGRFRRNLSIHRQHFNPEDFSDHAVLVETHDQAIYLQHDGQTWRKRDTEYVKTTVPMPWADSIQIRTMRRFDSKELQRVFKTQIVPKGTLLYSYHDVVREKQSLRWFGLAAKDTLDDAYGVWKRTGDVHYQHTSRVNTDISVWNLCKNVFMSNGLAKYADVDRLLDGSAEQGIFDGFLNYIQHHNKRDTWTRNQGKRLVWELFTKNGAFIFKLRDGFFYNFLVPHGIDCFLNSIGYYDRLDKFYGYELAFHRFDPDAVDYCGHKSETIPIR